MCRFVRSDAIGIRPNGDQRTATDTPDLRTDFPAVHYGVSDGVVSTRPAHQPHAEEPDLFRPRRETTAVGHTPSAY